MAEIGNARDVVCPYYKADRPGKLTLSCEGILPGSTMTHRYSDRPSYQYQIDVFCKSIKRCVKCPIHRVLDAKYTKKPLT